MPKVFKQYSAKFLFELLSIVAAVLIALALNDWAEKRSLQKKNHDLLDRIYAGIPEGLSEIREDLESANKTTDQLQNLIDFFEKQLLDNQVGVKAVKPTLSVEYNQSEKKETTPKNSAQGFKYNFNDPDGLHLWHLLEAKGDLSLLPENIFSIANDIRDFDTQYQTEVAQFKRHLMEKTYPVLLGGNYADQINQITLVKGKIDFFISLLTVRKKVYQEFQTAYGEYQASR